MGGTQRRVPVVVVGAGPTGLAAATLLGRFGVACTVLDRRTSVYPLPRAVHLDDEVYRILARLGLAEAFRAISRPSRGLRLVDPARGVLAEFLRDTGSGQNGYPQANVFDQPELERIMRANLRALDAVTMQGDTEVTGIAQDGGSEVRVQTLNPTTGEHDTIDADYVLGCDGANSVTRSAMGGSMTDLGFEQRWLVVDLATTADLGAWEGVHQVCDPVRAATYLRVGSTRYRWEFRLLPGETANDYREMDRLRPLLAPWLRDVPADELEAVRVAEYTFRAQVVDRWRDRRVFLLGDAAHLTPPFIGQGLGAGLRDAANLAWKLAGVLDGDLPEATLDSYEAERKPHATAMIRLAKLAGSVMTQGGKTGDLLRRAIAPRLHLVPGLKQQALDSETPALSRSSMVLRPRLGRSLAGRLCPNALVDGVRRLDDLAAGRFVIVTSEDVSAHRRAAAERRGRVVLSVAPGSELHAWLRRGGAHTALVRPDGTVLASRGTGLLPRAPSRRRRRGLREGAG